MTRTKPILDVHPVVWIHDLRKAPHHQEPGQRLIAWLESDDGANHVEQLTWLPYEDDISVETGAKGFWCESEELIANITGGIATDSEQYYWWAILPLPGS